MSWGIIVTDTFCGSFSSKVASKARSIMKLAVLRRPKHRREVAQTVIIREVCIRGDTDCTQGVSTWLTSKRAGDMFSNEFFLNLSKTKQYIFTPGLAFFVHVELKNSIHFYINSKFY